LTPGARIRTIDRSSLSQGMTMSIACNDCPRPPIGADFSLVDPDGSQRTILVLAPARMIEMEDEVAIKKASFSKALPELCLFGSA